MCKLEFMLPIYAEILDAKPCAQEFWVLTRLRP
jgi:hypothetical protein